MKFFNKACFVINMVPIGILVLKTKEAHWAHRSPENISQQKTQLWLYNQTRNVTKSLFEKKRKLPYEENWILKTQNCFLSLFCNPLFELTWIPFIKGRLLTSLVKIGTVLKKKILNIFNVISLLSPLGKGHGLSYEYAWIPFIQGCVL